MKTFISVLPLLILIVAMYFLMIRPQRKKDQEIKNMRNNLQVGDEIVTIGGIVGKIVKVKGENIVLQVGADKVKLEMTRWAVSSVTTPAKNASKSDDIKEEETPKKSMPKKLKKAADIEEEVAEEE